MLRPLTLTALWATTTSLVLAAPVVDQRSLPAPGLANLALEKVLAEASQVFGDYVYEDGPNANWMASYPDSTPITSMNIPGVHDAATWNYSQATQDALLHITALDGVPQYPAAAFRCQQRSFVDMLNAGIRVFDLRPAFDITNTTLLFWHSEGLVSEVATVDDVLFGFYTWLDAHPTETVFLSFEYEGSTTADASFDAATQLALYNTLTNPAARQYFLQRQGSLGTLGEARGKAILLQRFDLDQLPQSYTDALPGLHLSPNNWTDNDPTITLVYNPAGNLTAYIEDYYQPLTPVGTPTSTNIDVKYNATTANLLKAASGEYPDSLFWTFASSTVLTDVPPDTPRIMATGNGSSTPGVNQRLVPFLQGLKGKRVGWVMFDFYDVPSDLVQTLLDL